MCSGSGGCSGDGARMLRYSRLISGSQPSTTCHGDAQQRPEPRLPGVGVPILCTGVARTVT